MTDLTGATLRGATMLMSSQGLSRLLTFAGNVLLVRSMGNNAAPLGVSSTQFHLLYVSGISFTREGLRRACLRHLPPDLKESELHQAVSLAKAYSALSLAVFLPCTMAYLLYRHEQEEEEEGYAFDLALVGFGSALEVLAEPMYVVAQSLQWFKARSGIATLQSMARVFSGLFCSLVWGWQLRAFAMGYFVSGLVTLVAYCVVMSTGYLEAVVRSPASFALQTELGNLAKLTTVQSSWKVLLSEGENVLLLTSATSAADRGAFAIAAGLGSIAARLILQPCEEAAFTLFGKLEGSTITLFPVMMRLALVFAGLFACLGVNYTQVLVGVLYGSSSLPAITATWVSWYCVFIGVCAVNGISEALLQAKVNEQETRDFNVWLLGCSALFLALANFWLVPELGSGGLIAANTAVMLGRIARNVHFALTRVPGLQVARLLPPWPVALAFAASYAVTLHTREYASLAAPLGVAAHVAVGSACGLVVLTLVWLLDKEIVDTLAGAARWRRGGAVAPIVAREKVL